MTIYVALQTHASESVACIHGGMSDRSIHGQTKGVCSSIGIFLYLVHIERF
jgi:hypothetical protein